MIYLNVFGCVDSIMFTDIEELHNYIMKKLSKKIRKYFQNDIDRIFKNDRLDMENWGKLLLFYLNQSDKNHIYKFKNDYNWVLEKYERED